jgi:hypothetical protein
MAEPIVISGLKKKQEELRRRMADLEKQFQACRKDLLTISEALRVFGEPQSYAKPERRFGRGERARIIFDALRTAPEGLDTKELAAILVKEKGLVFNEAEIRDFERHTGIGMHNFTSREIVQKGEMRDGIRVWRLSQKPL